MESLHLLLPIGLGCVGFYILGRNWWRKHQADRATCLVCGNADVDGVMKGGFGTPDVLEDGYRCRTCGFDEGDIPDDMQPFHDALSRLDAERSNLVRARNTASSLGVWDISPNESGHLKHAAERLNAVREAFAEIRDDYPAIRDVSVPGTDESLGHFLTTRIQDSAPTDVPTASFIGYFGAARELSGEAKQLQRSFDIACQALRKRVRTKRGDSDQTA